MNGHAFCSSDGSAFAICSPRSPARARANGSLKMASGRSLSRARYTATQRAVSEMSRINGSLIARGLLIEIREPLSAISCQLLQANQKHIAAEVSARLHVGPHRRTQRLLPIRREDGPASVRRYDRNRQVPEI